jgi:hypothetical protein
MPFNLQSWSSPITRGVGLVREAWTMAWNNAIVDISAMSMLSEKRLKRNDQQCLLSEQHYIQRLWSATVIFVMSRDEQSRQHGQLKLATQICRSAVTYTARFTKVFIEDQAEGKLSGRVTLPAPGIFSPWASTENVLCRKMIQEASFGRCSSREACGILYPSNA